MTAVGLVTVAMILRRPSQRGHFNTSRAKTRSMSSAQVSLVPREGGAVAGPASVQSAGVAVGGDGAFGTISGRHFEFGASVPWYRSA